MTRDALRHLARAPIPAAAPSVAAGHEPRAHPDRQPERRGPAVVSCRGAMLQTRSIDRDGTKAVDTFAEHLVVDERQ
jgi:hypothetical protein